MLMQQTNADLTTYIVDYQWKVVLIAIPFFLSIVSDVMVISILVAAAFLVLLASSLSIFWVLSLGVKSI